MNRIRRVVGIGFAALSIHVAACAPFQAESYWGPSQKLSGLGATFAWKPGAKCEPDAGKAQDSDIAAAAQELLEENLKAKGYGRNSQGNADFTVCYRLGKQVAQAETGHGSWDEAVLEVDLTDPATGGLVWRGRVRGRIDYAATPDARRDRIGTAVRQLMQPLPKSSGH